jgi:hypothetical protein
MGGGACGRGEGMSDGMRRNVRKGVQMRRGDD